MDNDNFIAAVRSALGAIPQAAQVTDEQIVEAKPAGLRKVESDFPGTENLYANFVTPAKGAVYTTISDERQGIAKGIYEQLAEKFGKQGPVQDFYYVDNKTGNPVLTIAGRGKDYGENDAWQMTYEWRWDPRSGAQWVKTDDAELTRGNELLKDMRKRAASGTIYNLSGKAYGGTRWGRSEYGTPLEDELVTLSNNAGVVELFDMFSSNPDVNNRFNYYGAGNDYDFYKFMAENYDTYTPASQQAARNRYIDKNFYDFVNKIEYGTSAAGIPKRIYR